MTVAYNLAFQKKRKVYENHHADALEDNKTKYIRTGGKQDHLLTSGCGIPAP